MRCGLEQDSVGEHSWILTERRRLSMQKRGCILPTSSHSVQYVPLEVAAASIGQKDIAMNKSNQAVGCYIGLRRHLFATSARESSSKNNMLHELIMDLKCFMTMRPIVPE